MGECLSPADPDGLVQRSGRQLKSINLRWESRLADSEVRGSLGDCSTGLADLAPAGWAADGWNHGATALGAVRLGHQSGLDSRSAGQMVQRRPAVATAARRCLPCRLGDPLALLLHSSIAGGPAIAHPHASPDRTTRCDDRYGTLLRAILVVHREYNRRLPQIYQ